MSKPVPPRRAKRSVEPETVRYRPPRPGGLGVETLTLDQLRARGSAAHLAALQRLEFLMFVLYTGGHGEHVVDFATHPVAAHTLIVVRAGGLHQFRLVPGLQARLLLVEPGFLLPAHLPGLKPLHSPASWPACSRLSPRAGAELENLCEALAADVDRPAPRPLLEALARQRLYTWLLLVHLAWGEGAALPTAPSDLVASFEALLEQHHAHRWTVQDYARRLGYTERTLTRACQAHGGRSAKAMIDLRTVLEAKRMLAYTDDSVAVISHRLGFGDASPMVQFFRRLEGTTPAAFRRRIRAQGLAP